MVGRQSLIPRVRLSVVGTLLVLCFASQAFAAIDACRFAIVLIAR